MCQTRGVSSSIFNMLLRRWKQPAACSSGRNQVGLSEQRPRSRKRDAPYQTGLPADKGLLRTRFLWKDEEEEGGPG